MLQAHSLLWDYLWVAPNVYLLVLGLLIWRRGTAARIPAFVAFAVLSSLGQLSVFAADVIPSVSAPTFWRIDWVSLLVETFLKLLLFGAIFSRVFEPYRAVSSLGKSLFRGLGGVLVLLAVGFAAYAPSDSIYRLISGAHLLEQTAFIIVAGLILFLFLFAAYFHLTWDRASLGILLGLGISACVHLGTWAIMANAEPSVRGRTLLDFLNMATYHVCVMIWYYYLLVPQKVPIKPTLPSQDPPAGPPSGPLEEDLADWNRELERLIHK
jgi:hypothetical protein